MRKKRDKCQGKNCPGFGAPGNENVKDGLILCDDCGLDKPTIEEVIENAERLIKLPAKTHLEVYLRLTLARLLAELKEVPTCKCGAPLERLVFCVDECNKCYTKRMWNKEIK